MEPITAHIPRHTVINGVIALDRSCITVMCRGSKFQVYVSLDDLERSSHEREYFQLLGRIDGSGDKADDEAYDSLCRWITAPCSELFQELAPSASIPTNLTLQVFYYPPTYVLKLLVKEGALHVEHLPDELPESPAVLMLPAQNVPSQPQVPRLSAADLRIVPIGKPSEDIACDIPQRVCTAEGVVMFFKPGFHKSQFVREGKIQAKISDAGLRGKLRVSNLRGIVLSEDTTMIIGSVFDLIPSLAPNLESREYLQAQQHHGKWERQVQDIIERLHAHDIVWGDVHPGNIVIDTTLDAWAVDFGGGCVEEFVDREKSETEEGDWQGVRNIFQEWLVQKRVVGTQSDMTPEGGLFKRRRQVSALLHTWKPDFSVKSANHQPRLGGETEADVIQSRVTILP